MLLHPLPPPPHPVDFAASLIATSSSRISPAHLSRTTQLREVLRAALAAGQAHGRGARGPIEIKLVQAIEDYLPVLTAIYNSCQTDDLVWRAEAWFVWAPLLHLDPASPSSSTASSSSSSLSSPSSSSSSSAHVGPFASTSLLFELDNVLILYSLALSNLAVLQSVSCGQYEYSPTLDDAARKTHDASLKRGVTFGKRAVHIVSWLLSQHRGTGGGGGGVGLPGQGAGASSSSSEWWDRDHEGETARRRMLEGLLALHQLPPTLISLRLLLSASNAHFTATQQLPPPLPKGHPSPSLLSKLYLEVPRLASEAHRNFEAASGGTHGVKMTRRLFGKNTLAASSSSSDGTSTSREAGSRGKLASKFKNLGLGGGGGGGANSGSSSNGGGGGRRGDAADVGDSAHRSRADLGVGAIPGHQSGPGGHAGVTGADSSSSSSARRPPAALPRGTSRPPSLVPVSRALFLYLDALSALTQAIAFQYLALAAGEGGHPAEAIVWLRLATAELERLAGAHAAEAFLGRGEAGAGRGSGALSKFRSSGSGRGSPGTDDAPKSSKKSKQPINSLDAGDAHGNSPSASPSSHPSPHDHPLAPRLRSYHAALHRTARTHIHHLSAVYTRLNDSVAFEVLPHVEELYARIPSSRAVLPGLVPAENAGAERWEPPRPEFGPGSEPWGGGGGGGGGGERGAEGFGEHAAGAGLILGRGGGPSSGSGSGSGALNALGGGGGGAPSDEGPGSAGGGGGAYAGMGAYY